MITFGSLALAYLISCGLFAHLLLSRKSHASMILWTTWLFLFPFLGIPLYLVLGTESIRKKGLKPFEPEAHSENGKPDEAQVPDLLNHLQRVRRSALSTMSTPELLWGGDAFYDRLVSDIQNAQTFLHIQMYVWRDDKEGAKVLKALIDAVHRGVEVRMLVDEMGSYHTADKFFQSFREAGGQFSYTNTVQTRRSRFFFNLRNHRKLCLIDGQTAYVGGMNVGKEYAGRAIGPWTDLQMRFSGPVLLALQDSFAEDWNFATGECLEGEKYYPLEQAPAAKIPTVMVQSGPDVREPIYLKSFNLICGAAKERLDVFTPYFVPDPSILVTLQTAAARGVRVRMMIPTLNEHKYMVDIGRAYYEPLMESGVEIYELPERVNHTKAFRVDDDFIFAGSHNLDVRSYKLNFELSLCFRHRETAEAMDEVFDDLFEQSEQIELEPFRKRPLTQKFKQGFVKLFGPVL
ncbi:cardiolipin synthase [Kiritimatiellota bacterium B12222]|nr:cardiolipin synthase [Kiritimatiellota bacterium B12222]